MTYGHGSGQGHGTPPVWKQWLFTVDHRKIGIMYLVTAYFFFLVGGIEALLVRTELAGPGQTIVEAQTYNMLFSLHGTTMVFLWIIPVMAGFGNYFIPLMVGARDMSFPRLNAMSYWMYVAAGCLIYIGFLWGDIAAVGWTAYPPLSASPSGSVCLADDCSTYATRGVDLWILGVQLVGASSMLGGINFVVTVFKERSPDINWNNMPLFIWAQITTSFLVIFATPVIGTALIMLFFDRNYGTHFFVGAGSDPVLFQHLFWFYSHPAVYVMILPAMGIISEVLPRMVRRPIFGYHAIAYSSAAIGFLGFMVWAHHMFTTGIDPRVRMGFMLMTMIIAVPSGVKIFNWLATIWGGEVRFTAPMLWVLGFISMFTIGGIDGVYQAAIPVDYNLHDTYWVVSHLHYVVFGGSVLGVYAGIYYWWPRMTGRMYHKGLAVWHFWLTMIGLNIVFMTMHFLGLAGMPRRVYDYVDTYTAMNLFATIGAFILGLGQIPFLVNVFYSLKNGPRVAGDPWGGQPGIEWRSYRPEPGAVAVNAEAPEAWPKHAPAADGGAARTPTTSETFSGGK
ncbi:MAG TPA: cytochrome c oxidase subunit I [Candidatus Thermoplasmatota archaeon]|nr:cytochrome c oxidase subunit I [Candidatus Thermoplasmatota archaeon]